MTATKHMVSCSSTLLNVHNASLLALPCSANIVGDDNNQTNGQLQQHIPKRTECRFASIAMQCSARLSCTLVTLHHRAFESRRHLE